MRLPVKQRPQRDVLFSLLAVTLVIGFVVFVALVSYDDHNEYCESESDRSFYLPAYRPFDATEFGGTPAGSIYERIGSYDDDWGSAPGASDITGELCDQEAVFAGVEEHRRVSNLFWSWGQFTTHGFAHHKDDTGQPRVFSDLPNGFPGVVPSQSIVDEHGHVQAINFYEPYLDMSSIYGVTEEIEEAVRTNGGFLATTVSDVHGEDLLPIDDISGHFFSGDGRVTENVLLTAMHTLWVREHNYWVRSLRDEHPSWTSQHLFDVARHIVIGEAQAITYREWLPLLLNDRDLYGRLPCHQSSLQSTVFTEFASAAFRLGHTMVTDTLEARDLITGAIDPAVSLTLPESHGQFALNGSLWEHDIGTYLFGASLQEANQLDNRIVDALRGGLGFDLAAVNIARGRDHRLPPFQELYSIVTGRPFVDYAQLTSSLELQSAFYDVYGDPRYNKIDPWIAIISEDKYKGAFLGRVGTWIVAEQFALFRDADPYFYLWDDSTTYYRAKIHNTRLSDVIRRNTHISWEDLGPNAFELY